MPIRLKSTEDGYDIYHTQNGCIGRIQFSKSTIQFIKIQDAHRGNGYSSKAIRCLVDREDPPIMTTPVHSTRLHKALRKNGFIASEADPERKVLPEQQKITL